MAMRLCADSRSQTGFASLQPFGTFLSYTPEAWKNGDFIQQRKKRALEARTLATPPLSP